MSEKVHHDCLYAGNPYHECNDRCFERIISGDVLLKKKKKPLTFRNPPWRKESPPRISISPARVIERKISPLPNAKRMVESDESPSFSSSGDTFNANLFRPPSPLHGNIADSGKNWLHTSPSLAEYCEKDSFASKFDEAHTHYGVDTDMSPRTRPKMPQHPLRTPQQRPHTPHSRPSTPEHRSSSTDNSIALETSPRMPEHAYVALGPRPRAPDARPRTAERRTRSPEHREISSRQQSNTPEPQVKYLDSVGLKPPRKVESRPETPESRPKAEEYRADERARNPRQGSRIPQTQPTSLIIGGNYHPAAQRSPQATKYHGNKTNSVYSDECILLYPEIEKNPSSRPITPNRKKHQESDQLEESESIDDSNFPLLDDHDDGSVYLYPETATPPLRKSRKSSPKQSNELSDETGEETQSMMSESCVSVGSYKVRASVSATLQQILDKHGDIASGSRLESLPMRSNSLETLAEVVLELQSTPLKQLKETRVLEMLAVVKDVEAVRIRAGWLREALNEILEAAKHYDRRKTTGVEKDMCEREALLGRQEMEKIGKEVRLKEKEVKKYRQGLMEMAGRLGELEMKRARLEKSLAFMSSKVDKFEGDSVLGNNLF